MKAEHISTWTDDATNVTWSAYHLPGVGLTFFLKVGAHVIEIKHPQLLAAAELMVELMKDIPEEFANE